MRKSAPLKMATIIMTSDLVTLLVEKKNVFSSPIVPCDLALLAVRTKISNSVRNGPRSHGTIGEENGVFFGTAEMLRVVQANYGCHLLVTCLHILERFHLFSSKSDIFWKTAKMTKFAF